jgi:hypothetical protein
MGDSEILVKEDLMGFVPLTGTERFRDGRMGGDGQ